MVMRHFWLIFNRFVKENTLWACLAAISLYCRELNTAEIALAAIECVDKVRFVNYIKELPSEVSRNAALGLYFHKSSKFWLFRRVF